MTNLPHKTVIRVVQGAMRRAAAGVHLKMRGHVTSLASIAATAPMLGLIGTSLEIMNAFKGCPCGDQQAYALAFSQALIPTEVGLLVSISALWGYRHLNDELAVFDIEMKNAASELVDTLAQAG